VPAIFIEFELDSDELDDDTVAQTNFGHRIRPSNSDREQSMPLLVGLLDASAVRRSLDIPMGVDNTPECSDVDVEELVAKQGAGGGMLSSMANMANSILGAGAYPYPLPIAMADIGILAPPPSLQGIIGISFDHVAIFLQSEHFVRFALRHESRRVLHGTISPGHPFRHHRLDDPPHRGKRKAQRHEILHRNHEPLFWPEWARSCVLFPILFRIRRYVCVPRHSAHMSPHPSL
jgi:hypothetical protein